MTGGVPAIAALPMYDWPELRRETDRWWDRLRESLLDSGFPAPRHLDRANPAEILWRDERLLLAQSCGLPFVTELAGKVSLIGTPAYDIECGAGSYYSVIVVRADSRLQSLDHVGGARLAYNNRHSQSGYAALAHALAERPVRPKPFDSSVPTGSHRASIRAVADGRADIAAIDAVTWQIALRHEEVTDRLRILALTDPTPGLPFVCANRPDWHADHIHMAVVEAMAALDEDCRQKLHLAGFAHTMASDYDVIRERHERTKNTAL